QWLMFLVDTPGVGTVAPSRYSAMMPSEKASLLRRSGVRNADANAESTDPPAQRRTGAPGPEVSGRFTAPGVHPVADGHDGDRGAPQPVAIVTAHGPGTQNRGRARSTDGYSSVTEPPAAVIFWRALSENACALTCSTTPPRSPEPSTLTGAPRRTAPASTRVT